MADIHKIISRQIKSYFEDHNLTMEEVAEMMGCSQQAVSNQLSGRPIGGRVAKAYADLFGFDANYLITGVGTLLPEQAEERPLPKVQEGVFIPAETLKMYTSMAQSIDRLTQLVDRLTAKEGEGYISKGGIYSHSHLSK